MRHALILGCVALLGASAVAFGRGDGTIRAVPGGGQLVGRAGGLGVGVVTDQGRAVAFVTDGDQVGVWFGGPVRDGVASLRNSTGDRLTMDLPPKPASPAPAAACSAVAQTHG